MSKLHLDKHKTVEMINFYGFYYINLKFFRSGPSYQLLLHRWIGRIIQFQMKYLLY